MINLIHVAKKRLTFKTLYMLKYAVNGCVVNGGIDITIINNAIAATLNTSIKTSDLKTIFLGSDGFYYGQLDTPLKGNIALDKTFFNSNQFLLFDTSTNIITYSAIQINQTTGAKEKIIC